MGCIISKKGKVEEVDTLSFADYVVPSGAAVGFRVFDRKPAKPFDSGEIRLIDNQKKVQDKSSLFGRAGNYGLDKAVEVLDTFGSSVSNLNPNSGFFSGVPPRGNKIYVLAYEVANTIAKGSALMQSLSEENIEFLKKEVLTSEGVQKLVSTNSKELLSIVTADKREEFHVFSVEVARFGDRCKDPQWHNLARYFQKLDSDPTPKEKLREEAETTMLQLINLAQQTSELYHESHALDRFEQDYKRRLKEVESLPVDRRGENLTILHSEVKHQKKLVTNLRKKSLWSKNLEEIVENLVDVVVFLHKEIHEAFYVAGAHTINTAPLHGPPRLGVAGLALHYANVINKIYNIVSRPVPLPPSTRDLLYRSLPMGVKKALRSRLQSFSVPEELSVSITKAEMQKILQWIGPMAENTIKAHQGFGWVGEWANTSNEFSMQSSAQNSMFRIQTLFHADKDKTEEYILQLVVWLHHLVEQAKSKGFGVNSSKIGKDPPRKAALFSTVAKRNVHADKIIIFHLSQEDKQLLERASSKKRVIARSKSQDHLISKEKQSKRILGLSRSASSSPTKESSRTKEHRFERRNHLDVIDGLDRPHPVAPLFSEVMSF